MLGNAEQAALVVRHCLLVHVEDGGTFSAVGVQPQKLDFRTLQDSVPVWAERHIVRIANRSNPEPVGVEQGLERQGERHLVIRLNPNVFGGVQPACLLAVVDHQTYRTSYDSILIHKVFQSPLLCTSRHAGVNHREVLELEIAFGVRPGRSQYSVLRLGKQFH